MKKILALGITSILTLSTLEFYGEEKVDSFKNLGELQNLLNEDFNSINRYTSTFPKNLSIQVTTADLDGDGDLDVIASATYLRGDSKLDYSRAMFKMYENKIPQKN